MAEVGKQYKVGLIQSRLLIGCLACFNSQWKLLASVKKRAEQNRFTLFYVLLWTRAAESWGAV